MSDTVSSYLLYSAPPSNPLGSVVSTAINAGWSISKSDGEYEFRLESESATAQTVQELCDRIDSKSRASIRIEHDGLSIRIVKNERNSPISPLSHLRFRAWQADFAYSTSSMTRAEAVTRVEKYVDAIELAVEATSPAYGFGRPTSAVSPSAVPTIDDLLDSRISHAFWLNVFDAATVDHLGRDRVLSVPAWHVTELNSNHVIVVCWDHPNPSSEWEDSSDDLEGYSNRSNDWREALDAVGDHLGLET